jgi:hypothetical protein
VTRGRRVLTLLFLLTLPLVTPRIRAADEIQYYASLRSLVFDRDLDFGNEYLHFYERDPVGLAGFKATFLDQREPASGRYINFAPLGAAFLWSPFFLLAHGAVLAARGLGVAVAADGYSYPYLAAVSLASALYAFVALLLIHDLLQREGGFSERVATATVVGLWFATPVVYYMTIAPGFGHAPSLFAVSLLVWLSFAARRSDRVRDFFLVGLAGGLAGFVREQDVLFLILPAGLVAWQAFSRGAWRAGAARGIALGLGTALALLPQFAAYRALTGAWGPSKLVMRKMTFTSPHFWSVLFDPGHGLFLWSPILLLAAVGLAALAAANRWPKNSRAVFWRRLMAAGESCSAACLEFRRHTLLGTAGHQPRPDVPLSQRQVRQSGVVGRLVLLQRASLLSVGHRVFDLWQRWGYQSDASG